MLPNYKIKKIDQKRCQMLYQLIQKLPRNSSINKLLSLSNEFYIRNAYSNEYLYYGSETIRRLPNSSQQPVDVYFGRHHHKMWHSVRTNLTEKLTWKIESVGGAFMHDDNYFLQIYGNRTHNNLAAENDKIMMKVNWQPSIISCYHAGF